MGYIGDSRAIMGSKDSNDSMVAVQLTVDLKPDLPSMTNNSYLISMLKAWIFFLPAALIWS